MPTSIQIWAAAGNLGYQGLYDALLEQAVLPKTARPSAFQTSKPSGVDKLNGYRHAGETAILSKETKWGTFRTGAWYDWAYTDRYQVPSNILSQLDTPLGNFHEHFNHADFPAVC